MINRIQPFIEDNEEDRDSERRPTFHQSRGGVLQAVELIEGRTKDQQDRLFRSLQKLASDTAQHQAKLKWYREQLHLRLELNEQSWKKRIQQMLEEFDRLKDDLDESKLAIALKKYELNMKMKLFTLLERRRTEKIVQRLKEKALRGRILAPVFTCLHKNQTTDNILEFTDNIRQKKLKSLAMSQLATEAMRTVLKQLLDKADAQNEEVVLEYVEPIHDFGMCLAGQVGVLPSRNAKELPKIRAQRPKKTFKPMQKKFRQHQKIIIEAQAFQPVMTQPIQVFVQVQRQQKARKHTHKKTTCRHRTQVSLQEQQSNLPQRSSEELISQPNVYTEKQPSRRMTGYQSKANLPEQISSAELKGNAEKMSMKQIEDYLSELEQENKRLKMEAQMLQRYR